MARSVGVQPDPAGPVPPVVEHRARLSEAVSPGEPGQPGTPGAPVPLSRARRARRLTQPPIEPLSLAAPPNEPAAPVGRHAAPAPRPTEQPTDFPSTEPADVPPDAKALRAEAPFTTVDLLELMRSDTPPQGRPHDHEAVDHVARYAEQAKLARQERVQRARAEQERRIVARAERDRRIVAGVEETGRAQHAARVLAEAELPYTELPLEPQEPQLHFTGQLLTVNADTPPIAYRHQQVERRRAARSGRHSASQRSVIRPVATFSWLALAAGLGLGVLMLQRPQALWLQIIGFLLLLGLVPVSGFVVARGFKRGFGSVAAASTAGFFFVLAALRLSYFF